MIRRLTFILLFTVTAAVVIAGWTAAAPVIFAWQTIAGAWRGFRNASYIMRIGFDRTIKNYLEGVKRL